MRNKAINCNLFCILSLTLFTMNSCSFMSITSNENTPMGIDGEGSFSSDQIIEDGVYYYYQGEKFYMTERTDLVALQFSDCETMEAFISNMSKVSCLKIWEQKGQIKQGSIGNPLNILVLSSVQEEIDESIMQELKNLDEVHYISHPLERHGHLSVMTDEFSVKLNRVSDVQVLRSMANQYGCEVFKREIFDPDIYFVRCPKESDLGTLQIADVFYESELFGFAAPDFYEPDSNYSNDPYYYLQWELNNTGQFGASYGTDIKIALAWQITEGDDDIIIAVVDDGVELTHSDLSANIVTGYDVVLDISGGAPQNNYDSHGTPVAGIIGAAKDNNVGISGVAPGCKIMPVRTNLLYVSRAAGVKWAKEHGADVINCSWGSANPNDLMAAEIQSAVTQGRNGKGCVIVCATGNDNGPVAFPAYLGNVLGVGALSIYGARKSDSNYGVGLDLVAPGDQILSTGIGNDYVLFNQTSSAAPHVSGVAGLILSMYPNLPHELVTKAIKYSCSHPAGYSYTPIYDYPYYPARNNEVGYGMLTASEALYIANQLNQQAIIDATSGFDVTVVNNTSYLIEGVEVELFGEISGNPIVLFSSNMTDVASGQVLGYPVYRGYDLSYLSPGTTISNIQFVLYCCCPVGCTNGLRVSAQIDNPNPENSQVFSFENGNCSYQQSLSNSTIPNSSRRRLYIHINENI